jgi:hypothetical protein
MVELFDKYSEALGLWVLPENTEDDKVALKLQMGDGRRMRDIMMHNKNKKDKQFLFDRFAEFVKDLIVRDYPDAGEKGVLGYVEINLNLLFESAQLVFKMTTKKEMEKAKQAMLQETKKLIEGD